MLVLLYATTLRLLLTVALLSSVLPNSDVDKQTMHGCNHSVRWRIWHDEEMAGRIMAKLFARPGGGRKARISRPAYVLLFSLLVVEIFSVLFCGSIS